MRRIRILMLCVLITVSARAAVAAADNVRTDYNRQTDFSKYSTFMWIHEPKTENPLMKQRIIDAINAQLMAKGLHMVGSHADIGVSANTATPQEQTLQQFYDSLSGWEWRRPWGTLTTTADTYSIGTLVLDLFDGRTRQVVWWGEAADAVADKPEEHSKRLDKAVTRMFDDFPPKEARKEREFPDQIFETPQCESTPFRYGGLATNDGC